MNTLDRAINNDFLRVSKSLLPYLEPDMQRSIAVFIKAFELVSTIDLYSKEDTVRSMSRSHNTGWEKEFLHDLRSNLSDDRAHFIDAILKLTEARELLAHHEDENNFTPSFSDSNEPFNASETLPPPLATSSNGPNPADIINKLSSVLEPNQAQFLKILSSFISKPSS